MNVNLWFLLFAATQAIGAVFFILTFFGVTSDKLQMYVAAQSPLWLVAAAAGLLSGAIGTVLYARRRPCLLVIHSALWGKGPNPEHYVDVTEIVRGYIVRNQLNIEASQSYLSNHFGGEPRHLKVKYSCGAIKERTVVTRENEHLKLPGSN